jgi:hypothetical protein
MSLSMSQKMIISGSPIAYVHEIVDGVITELYNFNNITDPYYKIPKSGSSTTNGSYLDIKRADDAIIRFDRESLVLSGVDETDITPTETATDATGYGEMGLTVLEAPEQKNSMTAYQAEIMEKKDSLFLVTVATGYSYKSKTESGLKKPEGWAHMIGKISNDLEFKRSADNSLVIPHVFASYKNSGLVEADLTDPDLFTAVTYKRGGTGKDVTGIKPATITSAMATRLLAGKIAISSITYA